MKAYKDYMDHLSVDKHLHERILEKTRDRSSRQAVKIKASRIYIPLAASAAAIILFFAAVYPLFKPGKLPLPGESAAQTDDSIIKVDQSYLENTPIFQTIKQLSGASDYIFQGIFSRTEDVDGATWQWQIFQVNHLYKGWTDAKEIRMVGRTDADALTLRIGSEYLVFATAYELPVYPWPLINPVYNQTIFEIMPGGNILVPDTVERNMIPSVYSDEFQRDYHEIITGSVTSVLHQPAYSIATTYQDTADMLAHSDLAVKVSFSEIEYINEYVSIGKVGEIRAEYEREPDLVLPSTIAINENLVTGQEYLVFLRYDQEKESFVLTARTGAVISSSDTANWDQAVALFNSKP